jgi:hypothetical protein
LTESAVGRIRLNRPTSQSRLRKDVTDSDDADLNAIDQYRDILAGNEVDT